MWLLHTSTAELRWFDLNVRQPVRYAILSHVWGTNEQTFQDIQALRQSEQGGLEGASPKIRNFCAFARNRGYEWCWADTCCIDKTSSAELSEAINSMFQWYQSASLCVAILADVDETQSLKRKSSEFRRSIWFTRGWTLQELIAPAEMLFVGRTWSVLGSKATLGDLIEEITGVDRVVLTTSNAYSKTSVARRISWAAGRTTTRVEDEAYSLMGLFGVHMPTIYGEGRNAFLRLQEEILRRIPDQSIFAWGQKLTDINDIINHPRNIFFSDQRGDSNDLLLATSPASFAHSGDIGPLTPEAFRQRLRLTHDQFGMPQFNTTSYGMRAQLPIIPLRNKRIFLAVLACTDAQGRLVALVLGGLDQPQLEGWNATRDKGGPHTNGSRLLSVAGRGRTVPLPLKNRKNFSVRGSVQMADLCIRHRQDASAYQPVTRSTDVNTHVTAPCEIVLLPQTLDALSRRGYELFLPSTTPPPSSAMTHLHLRSSTGVTSHPPILIRAGEATVVRFTHQFSSHTIMIHFNKACAFHNSEQCRPRQDAMPLRASIYLGSLDECEFSTKKEFSCGFWTNDQVTPGTKVYSLSSDRRKLGVVDVTVAVLITFAVLTTKQTENPLVSMSLELSKSSRKCSGRNATGSKKRAQQLKATSDTRVKTHFLRRLLLAGRKIFTSIPPRRPLPPLSTPVTHHRSSAASPPSRSAPRLLLRKILRSFPSKNPLSGSRSHTRAVHTRSSASGHRSSSSRHNTFKPRRLLRKILRRVRSRRPLSPAYAPAATHRPSDTASPPSNHFKPLLRKILD